MTIEFHCACGAGLRVADKYAGKRAKCPKCGQPVTIPEPAAASQAGCPICKWPFEPQEETTRCPACQTQYHAECWKENEGCGMYGCTEAPAPKPLAALEIPASYWGQENKPCPACGTLILAAAMRCRNCGAVFESARPEARSEYRGRKVVQGRLPSLRRAVIWLFVFCVIPCTSPLAGIIGVFWYFSNRSDIKMLPALHGAIAKIALCLAAGQTLFLFLAVAVFAARGG